MRSESFDTATRREILARVIGRPLPTGGNELVLCINPEHAEEEPSMSVSAEALFHCHACGVGGSALDAVALAFGLDADRQFQRVVSKARNLLRSSQHHADVSAGSPEAPPRRYEPLVGADLVKAEARAARFLAKERQLDLSWIDGLTLEYASFEGRAEVIVVGQSFTDSMRPVRVARTLDPDAPKSRRYRLVGKDGSSALIQLVAPPEGDTCVAITEGIFDTLSALDAGMFAVSLPSGAKNLKKLDGALGEVARRFATVVIATDGDDAGHAAADELAATLYRRGARDIRRVQYPDETKDLNEVLVQRGLDEVTQLLHDAPPFLPSTAPGSWLDPPEALLKEDEPREWVVSDLIREGDAVIVAGRGDSGKSMLTLDLALALAGGSYSEFDHYFVVGERNVVVINEEMHAEDVRMRARRMALARGLPLEDVADRIRFGHDTGITLMGESFEKLAELCRQESGLVFIIDSLRPLLGEVPEVDNGATLRALRRLDPLRRGPGRHTFIILAHEAKAQYAKGEWQAVAGSGAIFNWSDLVLRVTRKDRDARSTFKIIKGRGHRQGGATRDFEIVEPSPGQLAIQWHELAPKAARRAAPAAETSEAEVLAALKGQSKPMTRKAILRQLGMDRGGEAYPVLDAVLARLVENGLVRRDDSSRYLTFQVVPAPSSS